MDTTNKDLTTHPTQSVDEPFISGAELDAEIEARKPEVDRTLLRENLKLTVEQRLLQLIQQARLADEFDRSRCASGMK
jgi:hypothetical protein